MYAVKRVCYCGFITKSVLYKWILSENTIHWCDPSHKLLLYSVRMERKISWRLLKWMNYMIRGLQVMYLI